MRYEVRQQQWQELGEEGDALRERQEQTTVFRYDVMSVDSNGTAEIRTTYESIRFVADSPVFGGLVYDSSVTNRSQVEQHPFAALFNALAGKSFTMTVDRFGTVQSVVGFRELLHEMLPGAGVSQLLSDDAIKAQLETMLRVVPLKAVEAGGHWAHLSHLAIPGIGVSREVTDYLLQRVEEVDGINCAVVLFRSVPGLKRTGADENADVLKPFSVKGRLFFDIEGGRLLKQEFYMDATQDFPPEREAGTESPAMHQRIRQVLTVNLLVPQE